MREDDWSGFGLGLRALQPCYGLEVYLHKQAASREETAHGEITRSRRIGVSQHRCRWLRAPGDSGCAVPAGSGRPSRSQPSEGSALDPADPAVVQIGEETWNLRNSSDTS